MLLIIGVVFATGCGKQKVVELPTAEASVEATVEATVAATTAASAEEAATAETTTVGTETTIETTAAESSDSADSTLDEDGIYTSKDDLATYIHEYGKLPQNFITKKDAKALGWPGGSLEEYAPGKCIGGDRFGNYEGLLPEEKGRKYYECDVDTLGKKSRGAKRIIYSSDGLIFYTEDHYESFEQLY